MPTAEKLNDPSVEHEKTYEEIRALVQSGTQESVERGISLLTEMAEKGLVDAQVDLGFLLACGQAEQRDLEKAVHWFGKAAEAGSAQAQFNLGALLKAGQGVEKNLPLAADAFGKAAKQGNMDAAFNYAAVLREIGADAEQLKDAVALVEKFGIEQKDAKCAYAAGLAATEGWTGDRDLVRAVSFFRIAVATGHVSAAYNLALILYYGEGGVEKDRAEARRLFEIAAKTGHEHAQQALDDPAWEEEA
jgi:hypothetical protein